MKLFLELMKDEDGATAIEYALIASLIAVAIIAGANTLGQTINNKFTTIATNISTSAR